MDWKRNMSLPKKKRAKIQLDDGRKENGEPIPEITKRRFLALRQFAWFLLILTQMAVVRRLEVRAEEQMLLPVEQEICYDYVEGAAEIPQQVTVTVQEGGQEAEVVCSLQRIEEEEAAWQDGFVLPITFHAYDADSYLFNGQIVPRSEEKPQLEGHEDALLTAAGLSGEQYRIRDIVWEGESYTDEDGQLCRDAAALGEKLVRSCRAYYAGTAVFSVPEAAPETAAFAQESRETVAEESDAGTEAAESGSEPGGASDGFTETEPEAEEERKPFPLWERITRTLLIAVGIGAALFFVGLFLLAGLRMAKIIYLWYINRRRKDKEDQSHVYRE